MSVVKNQPFLGSKQGCTYPTMEGMLSGISNRGGNFMKDAWISGYFDTKYMTVLRIEQIFHNFEDQHFANFSNLEQVNFCMTLITWG